MTSWVATTSPMSVLPDVRTMSRKPVITLTTMMTSATHSATAVAAIIGMMREVR